MTVNLKASSNIQVFSKKGKRFKPVKKKIVVEDDVELDYIASKKVKSIIVPPEYESKISYTVECSELMYFSSLRFFSNNTIDTLRYQVKVPKSFRFIHNTVYKDSLDYISIDSIPADGFTKWDITVVPDKIEPDPLAFFGIYKNKKSPLMRTLVMPASYEDGTKYLNDWYLQKVQAKRGLNEDVIAKIEELTKGISDPKQVMETLYDYVKNSFKYVAIEIGMGAFVPTHANEVFLNKEGDCKDLSNFLSEALNYKGIRSRIALAATYHHISDCDFPSLSSANHVICLVYLKDEPILLDPTDPVHYPETPVQSLQDRSILIIDANGGEWYKAHGFTPQQNLIDYDISLKVGPDGSSLEGTFESLHGGISGNFLKREFRRLGKSKINTIGKKHFESVFANQTISDLKVSPKTKLIGAEGQLSISGKLFDDANNRLLFIDFLPRLMETEEREVLLEGTHLGSNFDKKVSLTIEMEKHFEPFRPIEHSFTEKGIALHLKIYSTSDLVVKVDYEFIYDYAIIEKENRAITNEILKSFKKIINDPIILKKG